MISMTLHQAASISGGTLIGKSSLFRGVSTDSRAICKGKLFIALKGKNFNGEDFALQAESNGATAILCTQPLDLQITQIIVDDSLEAFSTLAKNWAKQCPAKKIGITGSNGKTTVKNMLHSILSKNHKCFATHGNLNNEIGVPLSLCQISKSDDFAIIEMGAAQKGDIKHLVSLVKLNSALITGISAAHIGRFGTLQNIAEGKSEMFSNLNQSDFAVINKDDSFFKIMSESTSSQILSFGKDESSNLRITNKKAFQLRIEGYDPITVKLPVLGEHNLYNAAAAAGLAHSLNVCTDDIVYGLENFVPEQGRLQELGKINKCLVINDSYNANPASMKAAIKVLSEFEGYKTLIIGDMAELGSDAPELHKEIGQFAKNNKINSVIAIGKHSNKVKNGFGESCQAFEEKTIATNYIKIHWQTMGTVLFKASRSMQLETIINEIKLLENAA